MNDSPDRPLLVFDGDCSFCRAWVEYWQQLTGDRVGYAPYQEVGARFPRIPQQEFARAVKVIMPNGEVRSGSYAVFSALASVPGRGWMRGLYDRVPGAAAITEAAYGVIARHRPLAYSLTKLLWGVPLAPATYQL